MKAIGMYIFCGSQTIGHLLEGWDIDTILEISDEMPNQNAYHFIKNYPNISVKTPSEYKNNDTYLKQLKDNNYDLLFANPPCSGLSTINRNANVNSKTNNYIYDVMDMVNTIRPKVFLIENAPTLTSTGLPILKKIAATLLDYNFIIINDKAGNHNVAMSRRRTFVIGFYKKYFYKLPIISCDAEPDTGIMNVLSSTDLTYNKEFVSDSLTDCFKYYNLVKPGDSFFRAMARNEVSDLPEKIQKEVEKIIYKQNNNLNIWDKSPYRPAPNEKAPSLASVIRIIHPIEDRDLYIREYAALMGYPDDFIFYPNECKTETIQCIAQGVPVNFIRYISKQIMNSFNTSKFIDGKVIYLNQTSYKDIKTKVYSNIESFQDTNTIYNTIDDLQRTFTFC